jgi:anti-sigma B factor antagonist
MDINIRRDGKTVIIELQGRFDARTAPPLKQRLSALVEEGNARIVVNMSAIDFVDSTGLATLVSGMKRCRQSGGDLKLIALQRPVRTIFELTRLDKAFDILPDEATAIASFGA